MINSFYWQAKLLDNQVGQQRSENIRGKMALEMNSNNRRIPATNLEKKKTTCATF